MLQCCVRSCGAHGVYRVADEQMTGTVAAHQKGSRGCVRQEDMCYSCDDSDRMMVCEKHAWNVIESHVAQQVLAETSKQTMARKDFIHDVLMGRCARVATASRRRRARRPADGAHASWLIS